MNFRVQHSAIATVLVSCCLVLAGTTAIRAQSNPSDEKFGPQPSCAKQAEKFYKANLRIHKGDPDMLVLPGLVASRQHNRVEILAESTGLASEEAAEFLLIDQTSSHGYEAMLWSYAKPSDVHKALVFLGAKPGLPFSPDNLRFWPEGERVLLSVVTTNGPFKDKPFRIEQLILDKETGKTLPEDGFVFTGSMVMNPPKGGQVYVADAYDPKSVASIYNEAAAVLDVPRSAPQGVLYGRQVVNPERILARGELLTVMMIPEIKDNQKRTQNFVLTVQPAPAQTNSAPAPTNSSESLPALQCLLNETDGQATNKPASIAATVVKLSTLEAQGRTPCITIRFDHALSLGDIQKVALMFALCEEKLGVRIKAPEAGELYYKAFIPEAAWRLPAGRPSQPWELRLAKSNGKLSASLSLNEPYWPKNSLEPAFSNYTFEVASPKALCETIDAEAARRKKAEMNPVPSVLFVFARDTLTYGELLSFIGPALSTHNTVHVYFERQ